MHRVPTEKTIPIAMHRVTTEITIPIAMHRVTTIKTIPIAMHLVPTKNFYKALRVNKIYLIKYILPNSFSKYKSAPDSRSLISEPFNLVSTLYR